jgi:hypothetical protein
MVARRRSNEGCPFALLEEIPVSLLVAVQVLVTLATINELVVVVMVVVVRDLCVGAVVEF